MMTSQGGGGGKRRAKSAVDRTYSSTSRDSTSSRDRKYDDDVTAERQPRNRNPAQSRGSAFVSKLVNGKM